MNVPMKWTDAPIMKWSLGTKEADGYLHPRDLDPGTGNTHARRWLDDFHVCLPVRVRRCYLFGIAERQNAGAHEWKWDGNMKAPTLEPSLQQHSACKWHGFVRTGEFVNT